MRECRCSGTPFFSAILHPPFSILSKKLANLHFWISTLAIVISAVSMYTSRVTQSLLWKQFTPPGMFFQELPDGRVSNVYDVKVLNKTFEPVSLRLQLHDRPGGEIRTVGEPLTIPRQAIPTAGLLRGVWRLKMEWCVDSAEYYAERVVVLP